MKELTVCPSTLERGYNTYSPSVRKVLFDNRAVSHIFSEPSPGVFNQRVYFIKYLCKDEKIKISTLFETLSERLIIGL